MRRILGFLVLSLVKICSKTFFHGNYQWPEGKPEKPWDDVHLIIFLNHTSLYEPLFIQTLPYKYLWHLSGHFNIPGADITLKRPIVGRFWKLMFPHIKPVSRKMDVTWESYLQSIKPSDVVMLAPEGRMKRPNGLDKFGRKMTVRAGVADIIDGLSEGKMIIALSGGLHHVQSPGQFLPRPFKTISMNLYQYEIREYRSRFPGSSRERKLHMVRDLQERLECDYPGSSKNRWQNSLHGELG